MRLLYGSSDTEKQAKDIDASFFGTCPTITFEVPPILVLYCQKRIVRIRTQIEPMIP